MNGSYTVPLSPNLQEKLIQMDEQRAQIETQKPKNPELWSAIQQKLRVDWTYDSNALEGSSLTRGETLAQADQGDLEPFVHFIASSLHQTQAAIL